MLRSREEEEEEEEAIPTLRSRGLRSRGPAILAEEEPAGESPVTKGADQPTTSSAQEKEVEAPQPSSPSVLMPASRVVEPSPTTRVLSGRPLFLRLPWSNCRLRRLRSTNIIPAKKSTSAMNPLFLIPANSHIYQKKRCRCSSLRRFHRQERLLPLRVFLLSSLIISPSGWESVLTFALNLFYRGGHW